MTGTDLDTERQMLRAALARYANQSNWLPTGIDRDRDDIAYLTYRAPGDGWEQAQAALENTTAGRTNIEALWKVALLAREYFTLPPTTQGNVWWHAEIKGSLQEALEELLGEALDNENISSIPGVPRLVYDTGEYIPSDALRAPESDETAAKGARIPDRLRGLLRGTMASLDRKLAEASTFTEPLTQSHEAYREKATTADERGIRDEWGSQDV